MRHILLLVNCSLIKMRESDRNMAIINSTIKITTLTISVLVFGLVLVAETNKGLAQDSGWWRCPAGHEIEVNPDRSLLRCVKHPEVRYQPVVCPALEIGPKGQAAKIAQDKNGDEDACVVGNSPYTAKPECPRRGFHLETAVGQDRCVLRIPGRISAPVPRS